MNEDGDGKIGYGTFAAMVFAAILADMVQEGLALIPMIGFIFAVTIVPVMSITMYFVFWFWFGLYNISLMSRDNFTSSLFTAVTEFLPGLASFFPGWTGFVIYTVVVSWYTTPAESEV